MRIGQGFDTHALVTGRRLVIGGVDIPYDQGLAGHSDADVLIHAVCDALLGAAGLGDIGMHFPDSDPRYKDIDSRKLLFETRQLVRERGFHVANVDATIIAQAPRMAPHIPRDAREHRFRPGHRRGRGKRQSQDHRETGVRRPGRGHRGGSGRPADEPRVTARLFFAAWPAAAVQRALHAVALQVRRECGGRAVAQGTSTSRWPLSATWRANGCSRSSRSRRVSTGSPAIFRWIAFSTGSTTGYCGPAWSIVLRPLVELAGRLSVDLRASGFKLDDRTYVPHITLLRNARCAPADRMLSRVHWPVVDFALIESVARGDGRAYEVVQRWPLKD
jgi:2-C-methyl-D-erythritol 2,4-cyclodiphosphate synthase